MPDLREFLNGNQFLSGGLVLSVLAGLLMLGRQWGLKLVAWLWRQCVVSVEVRNSDAPFDWLVLWLDQLPYTRRARRLLVSLDNTRGSKAPKAVGDSEDEDRPRVMFSPATGNHVFRFHRRPLWLTRERDEKAQAGDHSDLRYRERFKITMLGRSQTLLRAMLAEAYETYAARARQQVRIYTSVYESWTPQGFVRPRSLDSVILPGDEKERLLRDLRTFLASEGWYHEMGIPYRRGYLLHGVAGSGKSSLVAAVASAIGIHLYVVNLASTYGDSALMNLLQNISAPRAIILFEDIDCAAAARDRTKGEGGNNKDWITVAGLLNALDGVASRDGCVTIMTTNKRESLDPALTRPGRVDMELQFGYATLEQAHLLYHRFYGIGAGSGSLARTFPDDVSMAALQEHFLRHRDDPAGGANLHRLHAEGAGLKVVGRE